MKNRRSMKIFSCFLVIGIVLGLSFNAGAETNAAAEAEANTAKKVCTPVSGQMMETILPKESDPFAPFGRILGQFTGEIGGVTGASITAILLDPPGFNVDIRNTHAFLTGPGDVIRTEGITRFLPGPGSQCPLTPCTVENPQTLTIVGGTGKYAGASGQLTNLGQGQIDFLNGKGTFIFVVKGELCLLKVR